MKQRILIVLALLLAANSLAALYSDKFPLGTYSYLQTANTFFAQNRAELIREMQELGYNINIIETNNSEKDLNSLLKDLDMAGIDAVLTDKCYSQDPKDSKHYSIVALATSNYHRFEAEFSGARAVKKGDNLDNRFWYGNSGTIPRTGKVLNDPGASYEHVWYAARGLDKAGWIYTDVNYRFPDRKGNTVKLYDEIRFHKTHVSAKADKDSLYFTYRIKISNIQPDLREDSPLLAMEFYGHSGDKYSFGTKREVLLGDSGSSQKLFTVGDYKALGQPKEFFDIDLNISYNDLRASGLMTDDLDDNPDTPGHWWWYVLRHFAPGLYWHGTCDVALDYIDFEDQIHRNLRQNSAMYAKGINARLKEHLSLPNGRIIKHIYSMDEPFQTQLDSFDRIQNMISKDNPSLITASYDFRHRHYHQGEGKYWDLEELTRQIAKPKTSMPDIYPLQPSISYEPYAGENFLQNVLDHKLVKHYRESREYSLGKGAFYPIVQCFGNWSGDRWYSWIAPPKATQKMLLFFPLCYGANGVYHYQLQGHVSSAKGAGFYAPLVGINSESIQRSPYIYDVVKEINPRVKKLGEELQKWQWKGAATVMENSMYPALSFANTPLKQLRVKQNIGSLYSGYIETGLYQNTKGETALFAVNRRTNYLQTRMGLNRVDYIPLDSYNKAFAEFAPQSLVIHLPKGNKKTVVKDFETGKVYKAKGGKISVPLTAGDAKLLIFE